MESKSCSYCGYIHPAPMDNHCPIKVADEVGKDVWRKRGEEITKTLEIVRKKLCTMSEEEYKKEMGNLANKYR